jgi:hypothetical protein
MARLNNISVILGAAGLALVCLPAAGAEPAEKSGSTYSKPVCPKSVGAQVMRCHSLVVTDSKGNPVETPAPPKQVPHNKQHNH